MEVKFWCKETLQYVEVAKGCKYIIESNGEVVISQVNARNGVRMEFPAENLEPHFKKGTVRLYE